MSINQWFSVMIQQQRFLDIWLGKKYRSMLQSLGGLTFILEIGRLVASYGLMFSKKNHSFIEHEPSNVSVEEKNILGASGDELASQLFKFWNFDPLFVDSLKHSLNPDDGLEPATCAALKCARMLFTLKEVKPFEEIVPILEEYDFPMNDARVAYEMLLNANE
jgi:hypothetical protein